MNGDQSDNNAFASGAAYVFVRSAGVWTQQAYLKASNTQSEDLFGRTVAISGDTLVIGAFGEDSNTTGVNGNQSDNSASLSGAAYVFVRSGGVWTQQAYLKASNTEAFDQFGLALAISGDVVVVGAYAESSSATGVNGNQSDNSLPSSGAVYVFVRSAGVWSQQAYLKASNPEDGGVFGVTVGISDDTVVVGSPTEDSAATGVNGDQTNNDAPGSGAAYVFTGAGVTIPPTVVINGCDTGVPNHGFEDGTSFNDRIADCTARTTHGDCRSCVAHHLSEWRRMGLITREQRNAINDCEACTR